MTILRLTWKRLRRHEDTDIGGVAAGMSSAAKPLRVTKEARTYNAVSIVDKDHMNCRPGQEEASVKLVYDPDAGS